MAVSAILALRRRAGRIAVFVGRGRTFAEAGGLAAGATVVFAGEEVVAVKSST